jgi:hypothetical protein
MMLLSSAFGFFVSTTVNFMSNFRFSGEKLAELLSNSSAGAHNLALLKVGLIIFWRSAKRVRCAA